MIAAGAGSSGPLDPLETILPEGEDSPPPAGASGRWSSRWSSTSPTLPRLWRGGWDRGERCPPVARAEPRGGWRELGAVGGDTWRDLHAKRARVVNGLRRAGYVVRHRWAREDRAELGAERRRWHYATGPAADCRAVDPWSLARDLRECAASWVAQARITSGGELRAIALPRTCGRAHVCPVCAARESATMAAALRSLTGSGRGALVTMTHRDVRGRSLADELGRLRAAMSRLWSGRARDEWTSRIAAWWYGVETTYNAGGGWWHVHAHVVVKVADGADEDEVARWVGERWQAATARAAEAAGIPGAGWEPYSGGVRGDAWVTPDGGWWEPIDLSDPARVYQACKYPTPCVDLDPVQLAEFVAVAHGRRWHDGGGEWRGVRARADELAAEAAADGYDIGQGIARVGPGEAPVLDSVAPGLGGKAEPVAVELVPGDAVFWLTDGAPVELVRAAAEPRGGRLVLAEHRGAERWRLTLPASLVGALVHEWHRETRKVTDRDLPPDRERRRPPPAASPPSPFGAPPGSPASPAAPAGSRPPAG